MSQDKQSPVLPLPNSDNNSGKLDSSQNPAASLIRSKIDKLYASEPDATDELEESLAPGKHSVHQKYLLELHASGKSEAEVNQAWHDYYVSLDSTQKHQVWREFYDHQNTTSSINNQTHKSEPVSGTIEPETATEPLVQPKRSLKPKNLKLRKNQSSPKPKGSSDDTSRSKVKRELKSISFGLGVGTVFLLIYMFTFFNERYIIPFVQPSSLASATQVITEPGVAVPADPVVIVPKLNVTAPVVYGVQFIQPGEDPDLFEERTQAALEDGVVHYPTSQLPGQTGLDFNSNVVIVGHSSNNIFNRGDYKFAFMQLRNLDLGDTFMINYNGTQYVYRVYEEKVVAPTEVSVLGSAPRPNSATLITCDPPGFNTNRKIIIGEQISPSAATNVATAKPELPVTVTDQEIVPGNPETMWTRFMNWLF